MTKAKKIDALYKIAHGQNVSLTAAEQRELKKYKVDQYDGNHATRKNIAEYVNDVDKGYPLGFYDWCMNKLKGDRRRKGSSEQEIRSFNREQSISVALWGWLIWGIAIYWIFGGALTAGNCAILGIIVSVILFKLNRGLAGFTLFLLPAILAVVFGT